MARRGPWLLFAAAVLLAGSAIVVQRHFFHDDAFIVLRYVERLLDGRGLTWNDGERVEGFSSPAWLAQLGLLVRLGVAAPSAARGLGLAYAIAVVVLWYRARAEPAGLLAWITVPGVALWTWGGLETISACFWLLAALLLVRRLQHEEPSRGETIFLAVALAAVVLTRPEGIAVALACLAAAWPTRRRPAFLVAALTVGACFAGYEVFRLVYFGDVIANGVRAKALGLPVGERLENAAVYVVRTAPQWLAAVLLPAWLWATSPKRAGLAWLLLPILPLLLVVLAGGGDHMLGARFMLAPVAVLCLAACLAPPSPRRLVRRTTVVLAALAASWQLHLTLHNPAAPNPAAAVGEIVGRTLEASFPRGTWVAAATAGSLPYFAPSLCFIDTLGLNDRHIAGTAPAALPAALRRLADWSLVPGHHRGDGAYVLSRRPDVVILGGANGDVAPWFAGDYQLLMAREFQAGYAPWRLLLAVPPSARPWVEDELEAATGKLPLTLYVRRDSPAWAVVAAMATPLPPPWPAAATGTLPGLP